jgi:hypothetical protein
MTEEAWFIDALDARGGLAFASFRPAEDVGRMQTGETARTVFLAPPAFSPVIMASRATGLSATRSAFQDGIYIDGAEVPFHSIDDVIAFVSRLYGASGGGDAPGGGEGPPPIPEGPPPEGLLPEGPRDEFDKRGGRERDVSHQDGMRESTDEIATFAEKFVLACPPDFQDAKGRPSALHPHYWFIPLASDRPFYDARRKLYLANPLERAAVNLETELLLRFPWRGGAMDMLIWLDSVCALMNASVALGLDWNRLIDKSTGLNRRMNIPLLTKAFAQLTGADVSSGKGTPASLFAWHWWRMTSLWRGRLWPLRPIRLEQDPLELLGILPLPPSVRGLDVWTDGACPGSDLSLLNLVSFATSSPGFMAKAPTDVIDLVIFAACVLARTSSSGAFGHALWEIWDKHSRSMLFSEHMDAVQRRGMQWLAESLPDRALPMPLERLIEGAPKLVYA